MLLVVPRMEVGLDVVPIFFPLPLQRHLATLGIRRDITLNKIRYWLRYDDPKRISDPKENKRRP